MAWSERTEPIEGLTFNELDITFNQVGYVFNAVWFRKRTKDSASWTERAETADAWTERT